MDYYININSDHTIRDKIDMMTDTNTNTYTSTADQSFFIIWRHKYLRKQIRNRVFKGYTISVPSLEYLDNNHQYLALLSDDDKLEYNIDIYFEINSSNIDDYAINKYRYLLNYVFCKSIDLTILPNHHVHNMTLLIDQDDFHPIAQLPHSLRTLYIFNFQYDLNEMLSYIDSFIYSLPSMLTTLMIPNEYVFRNQCILPQTLDHLVYTKTSDSLCHLVVPPTKVYKDCVLKVQSIQDLQWLYDKTWIVRIQILDDQPMILTNHLLPNHIRDIEIGGGFGSYDNEKIIIEDNALPLSLTSLRLNCKHTITHGMLPAGLKKLHHATFNQDIVHDLLPSSLDTLELKKFNRPLQPSTLPSKLKKLILLDYNHELQQGILPPTIQHLCLDDYNHPLNNNVLPPSLTNLILPKFSHTFSSNGQLNKLSHLQVMNLNESVLTLISNIKNINIKFFNISSNATLYNTSIENLNIHSLNVEILELPSNFFPPSLRHLDLRRINIKTNGVINDGCISVFSDRDIDYSLIPQSVTKINNKKRS